MRLFSAKSKTGEFLSQSVFRAKLCAWKTSIDSSIQAQESGEVMRRKWRGYGNSYKARAQWIPFHSDFRKKRPGHPSRPGPIFALCRKVCLSRKVSYLPHRRTNPKM